MKPLLHLAALLCAAVLAHADVAFVTTDSDDKVARIGSNHAVTDFIASGLSNPSGLVFDEAGNLFVANFGSGAADGTVLKFPAGGGQPVTMASSLNGPKGLAISSSGVLHVAVSGANQILKITAPNTTTPLATLGGSDNPQGIAFDTNDDLYVACKGGNRIVAISPAGLIDPFSTDVTAPTAVAFVKGSLRAVGGGNSGVIYNFRGQGKSAVFLAGFVDPRAITVDRFDNLYVVNGGDNSVKMVTPSKDVSVVAGNLNDPQFVTVRGPSFKVVAAKGDLVSDGVTNNTVKFAVLGQPAVATSGHVAFGGSMVVDNSNVTAASAKGLWRNAPDGSRELIARATFTAPGATIPNSMSLATFGTFSDPVLNASGKVAFRATLRTTLNPSGIWTDAGGSLALAVRAGDPPGGVMVPSGTPRFTAFSSLYLPDNGQPIFLATIAGSGITTATNQGIWQATGPGTTQLLLRKGDSFTFGTKTVKVTAISFLKPVPFAGGQSRSVAPNSGLSALVTFSDLSKAILRVRAAPAEILAHKGDSITVDPPNPTTAPLAALFTPAISQLGDVAWRGTVVTGSNGITAANASFIFQEVFGGSRTIIARAGSAAGGTARSGKPNANFATLADPVINAAGEVAFRGTLKVGTGDAVLGNTVGLWSTSSGNPATVQLRQGDTAPGTSAKFNAFTSYVLLDHGGIATLATLIGTGIDTTNNQGIWAVDADGVLQKVLQKKDPLEVNGASRTVSSLKIFSALPFVAGQGRSYSGTGDLALLAGFTDLSTAILRVTFP